MRYCNDTKSSTWYHFFIFFNPCICIYVFSITFSLSMGSLLYTKLYLKLGSLQKSLYYVLCYYYYITYLLLDKRTYWIRHMKMPITRHIRKITFMCLHTRTVPFRRCHCDLTMYKLVLPWGHIRAMTSINIQYPRYGCFKSFMWTKRQHLWHLCIQ